MGCEGECGGGAYRGAEGVQRGAEGAGGCRGVQSVLRGADRVPRGTEREGAAGVEVQMDLLVMLEFLGRCPNALHHVLQTVRGSEWARSGAAHCGQEPWHMGVQGGEAAGRETRGSNGDGESTGAKKRELPRSHQIMARMRCVGAPERWPLGPHQTCGETGPHQICGETSPDLVHCLCLCWQPNRPWSTCAPQCWPPRHP